MTGADSALCSSEHAYFFYLSVQELLCYLIDDGGFLIMSNQKEDWNRVSIPTSPSYQSSDHHSHW